MNQVDQTQDPTPVPPKGTDIVIAFQDANRPANEREKRYNINVPTVPSVGSRFVYIDGAIEHRGKVTDVIYMLINGNWTITVTVDENQ
tara:strand:- start:953 stop:1216 length:264 start_codon:yes stop_codon:yes gene_type:complete